MGTLGAGDELSPALYNRFVVVHVPDVIGYEGNEKNLATFRMEIEPMITANLLAESAAVEGVCMLCWEIISRTNRNAVIITVRSLVRLLNSSFLLQMQYHENDDGERLNLYSALWAAFKVTLGSQIEDLELAQDVHAKLVALNSGKVLKEVDFSNHTDDTSVERVPYDIVLTASRRVQASAVIGCIQCGMPVLLEGPAAVGKTALIEFLSRRLLRDKAVKTPLLRVNNSASTTVQDYLGSYLPSGKGGFHFSEGALIKAMRCGYWFLADEFNLAEPAVMSILYPVLEAISDVERSSVTLFCENPLGRYLEHRVEALQHRRLTMVEVVK
jgi:hypothetical protein